MMMQWLVNEVRGFNKQITEKVDAAIASWAKSQIDSAERLTKLEGEIRAMKARMGKNKE
jgi:hypothetical protein